MPDIYINPEVETKPQEDPKPEEVNSKPEVIEPLEASDKMDPVTKPSENGHSKNPFAAYRYCPDNVSFEGVEDGEQIVLFLRQHPIVNVKWIIIAILMSLAPLLLTIFPFLESFPDNYVVVSIMGWYLIVFASIIEGFYRWFFNIYIVTTRRIVDINFYNLIYKQVSNAGLGKVQDVTYQVGGALRTTLNYGDVFVQTAAETPTIDFLAVPKPREVVGIIRDTIDDFKNFILDNS